MVDLAVIIYFIIMIIINFETSDLVEGIVAVMIDEYVAIITSSEYMSSIIIDLNTSNRGTMSSIL